MQWGKLKSINGSKYLPLINTKNFAKESEDSLIHSVILVDRAEGAKDDLKTLNEQYSDQPYSNWFK